MNKDTCEKKMTNYIEDDTHKLTYYEIEDRIDRSKSLLLNFELCSKDVVIIECENSIDFIILFLSLKEIKVSIVPISNSITEVEFASIISKVEPSCLLVKRLKKYTSHNNYEEIQNTYFFKRISKKKNKSSKGFLIMHTSGTTGNSLPVALSLDSLDMTTSKIRNFLGIGSLDTFLVAKNISHCSTLIGEVLTAISVRANIILKNTSVSPSIIFKRIEDYKVTFIGLNPSMISLITKTSKKITNKQLTVISSGDILKPITIKNFKQKFPNIELINAYGLTEAGPRVAMNRVTSESYCCGYLLEGVEVKIMNEATGKTCSPQESGEIFIKSNTLMEGYYNNKVATRKIFREGWLKTNDLGYVSHDKLYVTGRAGTRIISGGRNIDPIKIENIIEKQYRAIDEIVIIGVNDSFLGEKIICLFTSSHIEKVEELSTDFNSDLINILESYEIPRQFLKVSNLRKTTSGKISRKLNKDAFERGAL